MNETKMDQPTIETLRRVADEYRLRADVLDDIIATSKFPTPSVSQNRRQRGCSSADVIDVLQGVGRPMRARDVRAALLSRGYGVSKSSVSSFLSRSDDCRTAPGRYWELTPNAARIEE